MHFLYKTNRIHAAWVFFMIIVTDDVTNVVKTSVIHSAALRVPLFYSYHILTLSVISY